MGRNLKTSHFHLFHVASRTPFSHASQIRAGSLIKVRVSRLSQPDRQETPSNHITSDTPLLYIKPVMQLFNRVLLLVLDQ